MSVVHKACPSCTSSDGYADYGEGKGGHCFVCQYTVPSDDYLEEQQAKKNGKNKVKQPKKDQMTQEKEIKVKDPITAEKRQHIKDSTSGSVSEWREISDETCKHFGLRGEYNESSGELEAVYYPITRDNELVGYKKRTLPKSFIGIGDTTVTTQLYGQFRYTNKQEKYCLITEGEMCATSAFQMLNEYNSSRGKDYGKPVVVGITCGAGSAHKQVQANYEFFTQFTKVIVAMDGDVPGQEASEKIAKVLPRGKAFILKGNLKDCSEYLEKGKAKEFLNTYFNAKPYVPASLHSSSDLYDEALKYADLDKIPLPLWLAEMNDMMAGGYAKSAIHLIAAGSSTGKSTFLNQLFVDWIMENKTRPEERKEVYGVLSLEATAGEYATQLLSYFCKQKFINIKDREERLKVMGTREVKEKADELFTDSEGRPSFLLCDDRGASIDDVEVKIEEMIRSMGITVLLIDVISDLLSGVENSRQEEHMAFQKRLVKETGVAVINVTHLRKSGGGEKDKSRGAEITDSDVIGSSTLVKSASTVVGLVRDKMAETDLERNTVKLRILKSRHAGTTGNAGDLYYDSNEHKLVPLADWLRDNGVESF
jgi:twinkle protein